MVPFWVPLIIRSLIWGLIFGTQKGTIIFDNPPNLVTTYHGPPSSDQDPWKFGDPRPLWGCRVLGLMVLGF